MKSLGIPLFALLPLFILLSSQAQSTFPICASDQILQEQLNSDAQFRARHEAIEQQLYRILENVQGNLPGQRQVYTIPVVVHIVHNNGNENISDTQIMDGIQHLNDGFRNVGTFDPNTGVDVGIEFCLAQQDPSGNATNGITRTQSSLTDMVLEYQDIPLKNLSRWDPTQYLNIWVIKEIRSASAGSGVAGYAYFPSSHGTSRDGIVCEARYFGSSANNSKVHIHEAGHYLGVYHTFQNGCGNYNCLLDGDHCCDTPPDGTTAPVSCNGSINSCTTDADDLSPNNPFRPVANGGLGDQNDMHINYMDYGNIPCFTAFTQGQKNRMVASLLNIRSSLLQSHGCQPPCPNPVTASFSASSTNVNPGATVNFTNNSTGATGYDWQINSTSFSSSANPSYIFNGTGAFTITLVASNGTPACTDNFSITIDVVCQAQASFSASSVHVNPTESVTFTNTSTNASTNEWFVDNVSVATTSNYTHTFSTPGIYEVLLVVSNGSCYDTSAIEYIQVGSCPGSNRANIWYFGSWAGLDFNGGFPVPITGGSIHSSSCSSISDENGNFLFHTNGEYVYNRNGDQMPNGFIDGTTDVARHSVIIIPYPGSDSLYYIFNFKNPNNPPNIMKYHIVDMSLDGGLGDVISSTSMIVTHSGFSAVPHANGRDYWLIMMQSSDAYAYLINPQGLQSPVVSQNVSSSSGGGLIANYSYNQLGLYGSSGFELLGFDNASGVVSATSLTITRNDIRYARFSPDGTKLYVSSNIHNQGIGAVYQYDLSAGTQTDVINSETLLTNGFLPNRGMQLGPDGVIYIGSPDTSLTRPNINYLHTINHPNRAGSACDFQYKTIGLILGSQVVSEFPNFPVNFLVGRPQLSIVGPNPVTEGTNLVQYEISENHDVGSIYSWILHGNSTIYSQTDSTIVLNIGIAGTDTLICIRQTSCNIITDTLFIDIAPLINLNIGNDTSFCNGSSILLDAGSGYADYLWQDSSTNQTFTATSTGTYWVQVTDNAGYTATDTMRILDVLSQPPDIDAGGITSLCTGNIAVLDAGTGYLNYTWQDGLSGQQYTAYYPGTYSVTVSDACGNSASDSITLNPNNQNLVDLGKDTIYCGDDITVDAGSGYSYYIWQDGSTSQSYTISSTGTYWVSVTTSAGCYDVDSIKVSECTSVDRTLLDHFEVHPNPADEMINISFSNPTNEKTTVSLNNALGKEVLHKSINDAKKTQLDLSTIPHGIYFIRLQLGQQFLVKKIVVY